MPVKLAPIGFCEGVKNALRIAEEGAKKYGAVYCLHPIIHNKRVVEDLQNKNVFVCKEQDLPENAVVCISAHGATPGTFERMEKGGYTVLDATCPFVRSLHEKVKAASESDAKVLLIGDKNHAEVIGTAGYSTDCQVVSCAEEVDFSGFDRFFVCAQTTVAPETFEKISKKIVKLGENLKKIVEVFNSICYNTLVRQKIAVEMAKECDVVVVVGDINSSNCQKLYSTVKNFCDDCLLIENASDVKSAQINILRKVGIISGASTPMELSMEVFNSMNEEQNTAITTNESIEEVSAPVAEGTATEEVAAESDKDFASMDEAMKSNQYGPKNYREGKRLTTKVVSADANGITVTIVGGAGKNDCGYIAAEEAEIDGNYNSENYTPDMEIEALVIPKKPGDGNKTMINLSKKAFDAIKLDDEKVKGILDGEEFKMVVTSVVPKGLLGKIGTYTIFVPGSQIKMGYVNNLEEYVGKELRLRAIPAKVELDEEGNPKKPRSQKRIVASARVILEEEKKAREEEFWSKVYVGARVTGKVKRFADFGAFVSLKYMDALVRNSELSWSKKRINHPSEVLELNKTYEFVVKSVERSEDGKSDKVSLSYKDLQKKPWEIAMEKYPVGTVVRGKVARIMKYGAFVELEPGIDGLVHISQINHGWIANAAEALKEGDEVEVKVMSYENERITLSIKELLEAPAEPEVAETAEEGGSERPSRTASFNKRLEGQEKGERKEKKGRKAKEEDDGEPREYVSNGAGATLGDLFKNLKVDDGEDKE